MGHWLAQRLEITISEGLRLTNAAHVLERCTLLASYLEEGRISLDKVMQLARFITPETEQDLIRWAKKVTLRTVRSRATLETRRERAEATNAHDARYLRFYPLDEIGSMGIDGRLPAEQGAVLAKTIEKIAAGLVPPPEDDIEREQRNADALIELVRDYGGAGSTDRPTLVVHTSIEALRRDKGSEIEDGPVIHPEITRRIACDCKLRVVIDDENGHPLGIGYTSRNIPRWLRRLVKRRDGCCVFPGCDRKANVDCHHVVFWPDGPTQLDNLVLLCPFHHGLVHEGGWKVVLDEEQKSVWFKPDGSRFEGGLRIHRSRLDDDDNDAETGTSGSTRLALIAATFG